MLQKVINLIIDFLRIKEKISYKQHWMRDGKCLFCGQNAEQVESFGESGMPQICNQVKYNKAIVQSRVTVYFRERIIELFGKKADFFVPIKAWLKIPIWEHFKRFMKRHLR